MALIRTIQEIKTLIPGAVSALSDTSLLPNMEKAEAKYLVPLVGSALYADISTKYNNSTLSSEETKLLKKMQLVVVCAAYSDELAFKQIHLSDTGLRRLATGGNPNAYQWEVELFGDALKATMADAVDVLLQYLYDNKSSYSLWTASTAYTQFNELLIKTGNEFYGYYTLFQPNRTFYIIKNNVKVAQQQYLQETIGDDLFTYLNGLSNPSVKLQVVLMQLKYALAFYSVAKAAEHLSVRFTENGFTVLNSDAMSATDRGRTNASADMLNLKIKACYNDGADYLGKAKAKMYEYYSDPAAAAEFKTAYEAGPMVNFVSKASVDKGNKTRNIFRM